MFWRLTVKNRARYRRRTPATMDPGSIDPKGVEGVFYSRARRGLAVDVPRPVRRGWLIWNPEPFSIGYR
jgi:hypothetical protein